MNIQEQFGREIKFRGQLMSGEWVYGYLFKIWEKAYILWGTTNGLPNMTEVDPKTVGQYTGLKDKNDKEIYEGDVVYSKLHELTGYIVYVGTAFNIQPFDHRGYVYLGEHDESDIEVIGNVLEKK